MVQIDNSTLILRNQIDVAADAFQEVSGLTRESAKTCAYYAVMTYLLDTYPDNFLVPILCLQGNSGTGKSKTLQLMEKLVKGPTRLNGRGKTFSEIGISLNNVTTTIIEEADFRQDRVETQLLQLRAYRQHQNQVINMPPEQTRRPIVNFGATIVEKRIPFSDAAVRNRTITIKTTRRVGEYREVVDLDIDEAGIKMVADFVRQRKIQMPVSNRVMECWRPLMEIAATIGDFDWIIQLDSEYKKAQKMLAIGDQYESEDILLKAVIAAGGLVQNLKLKSINDVLEQEFQLHWSTQKVHTTLTSLGFETTFNGKNVVLVNPGVLLRQMAAEKNIPLGEPV